jgi:predicted acyltransferase (DUF342 family)
MSWKKYGGINQQEQLNNLNVNTLVIDNLSVRNAYQGNFSICGELIISNNAYFNSDVDIIGNAYINSNASIQDSLHVGLNTDISNNLSIHGNTFQYNPLYLVGTNGQGRIPSTNKGTMYFLGDISGVGMNKINPESTLDICGSTIASLNVFTNQTTNRNILARNKHNYGITLTTDLSKSSIDFFHSDKTIRPINNGSGAASIVYDPCGNLSIQTSKDTVFYSNVAITNRKDALRSHMKKETVVIYDNSSSVYLPDIYTNNYNPNTGTLNTTNYNTGTTLSLVASDPSATTFLNISNTTKGWQWGAGSFPNDLSRNMATTGWTNDDGKYIPSETILSGNSLVKTRSTIGINTYSPETEKYGMDINAPIHLHHNEIHLVAGISFEIISMSFSSDKKYGVAIGSPVTYTSPYGYYILYTTNSGESWNISDITNINSGLLTKDTKFNVFFQDYSNVIISGGSGYTYRSINGGMTWSYLNLSVNNENIPSIFIAENKRLFFSYPLETTNAGINYYDISAAISNYTNQNNNFIDSPFNIYSSHGYNNILFVAGNGISTYDASMLIQKNTTGKIDASYNAIYTLDGSYAVAVGNNIISYTKNGGNNWIHNTNYTNTIFRDVFIQDLSNAIIVGDRSTILYTKNGGIQWTPLLLSDINAMGNGNRLLNPLNKISNIRMIDINRFLFSVVTSNYIHRQQNGKTEIYSAYIPTIFNTINSKSLLDISGNMVITGDIHINDSGSLKTNNTDFYLVNQNANRVFLAGDASTIFIGKSDISGRTVIRHQLDVSENTVLRKDLSVIGTERIFDITNATDISSGALQVYGGTSIKKDIFIGGNAIFYRDISLNGNQIINGNLFVNKNTSLGSDNSNNTVILNAKTFCYGNVFMQQNLSIQGDISVNNNIYIGKDISANRNLYLNNNAYINNTIFVQQDTILNRNLYIANDSSLNGKLFVAGDISLNGNISIGKDVSFNGNVYISKNEFISGKLTVLGDVSLNGNQIINGNIIINQNQTVNGNAFLNGNITLGNGTNDILTVNAASLFETDISINKTLNVIGNTNLNNNLYITGDSSMSGSAYIYGNLKTTGSNIIFGTDPTDKFIINSQTNIKNKLLVNSDISLNGNLYVNNSNTLYSNTIDSLSFGLNGFDSSGGSTINIANNTNIVKIGNKASFIEIGRPGCDLRLYGNYSAPIVQPDIRIYLNTLTSSLNAQLAGVYIKEGYPTFDGNTGNTFDAAYMITSYDRNKFKFKVPNSDNVVALNVNTLTLPQDMNSGLLVINRNPFSILNTSDNDICYNINVSTYDISNVVLRNKLLSTANTQVIQSNLSLIGNMTINQPTNYIAKTVLDISGNISQINGYITQF